jgi:hypothetical protein
MLCLGQRGDDLCDSLGHLRLGSVEVHSELRSLTHFTVARSISNGTGSPGTKICSASVIPPETEAFPVM